MSITAKLIEAGVEFEKVEFLSTFYGTRFTFPNLKEARKAYKATGLDPSKLRAGGYALEIF